jgi:hypothetical protein
VSAYSRGGAVCEGEPGQAGSGQDPWERVRATVTAYRRFAIDKPRRYRLMFSGVGEAVV